MNAQTETNLNQYDLDWAKNYIFSFAYKSQYSNLPSKLHFKEFGTHIHRIPKPDFFYSVQILVSRLANLARKFILNKNLGRNNGYSS